MKYFNRLLISLLIVAFAFGLTMAEEGMYPLSEIHKLDLQKKGLQISPQEIYNPNDISIIDAICIVGRGCTGSFVSEDGLILTNHHCAYGAVQSASTKEKDYIKDGFIAQSREEEIIAKAEVCRIALVDGDTPYIVPMNFGYIDHTLYLHCAKEGKKIDIIKKNNNVCFEMDIDRENVIADVPAASTTHYKSVIGFGKAYFVEDRDEKIKALNALMHHYVKDKTKTFDYGKTLDAVQVIRVEISSMTGKANPPM